MSQATRSTDAGKSRPSRATALLAGFLCLSSSLGSPTVMAAQKGTGAMTRKSDCGRNALELSRCMIEAILTDLSATYTRVGGGGITEIKMIATNTFTVSISQEERVDRVTYELRLKAGGGVEIVNRREGGEPQGR